ncbi:MAG: AP2 domain-containing protein [Raoultibacter sp.]
MNAKNLTNKQFGSLKAIKQTDKRSHGSIVWLCKCKCGNMCEVSARNLIQEHVKSCGCAKGTPIKKGDKFDALTAIEIVDHDKFGMAIWLCECTCGKSTRVRAGALRSGGTTSCGCRVVQKARAAESQGRVEGTKLSALTSKTPKNNTSGVKGVTYERSRNRWIAQIKYQGKRRHIGSFKTCEEAAEARRKAEEELFAPMLRKYGRSND